MDMDFPATSTTRETSPVFDDGLSFENGFRGFKKLPIVLLERVDITPFLNHQSQHIQNRNKTMDDADKLHLYKLSLQVSVVLVRTDLDKLKKEFNETRNINNNMCSKSNKILSRLKSSKNIKDERQPQKRVSFSDCVIVHEVSAYKQCMKCEYRFKNNETIKQHTKRTQEILYYMCNYCSKNCTTCGTHLGKKTQYLDQKGKICSNKKLYTCEQCKENYFRTIDLKDHSFVNINSCFVCDICKDQFNNKCSISHHILFKHTKKRMRELYTTCNLGVNRFYLCNFCDESTIDKVAIESHVSLLPDYLKKSDKEILDSSQLQLVINKNTCENYLLQQETTKDASDSIQQLKFVTKNKRNTRKECEASLKECVTKSNSSQQPIDLTNEDESNNATLDLASNNTSSKYLNVLTDKTASENSTNNLSVNNSSKKPNQKSAKPNDFSSKTIDFTNPPKKAIVDPKSKKTIISRHHCEVCGKYLSSNFTLMRHKFTVHTGDVETGCDLCGEKFARPFLLKCHRCPFNNRSLYVAAGPGVPFNNTANSSDVVDLADDGMDDEDFEIPAPIVELTEYNGSEALVSGVNNTCVVSLENVRYNILVQEVPIEF